MHRRNSFGFDDFDRIPLIGSMDDDDRDIFMRDRGHWWLTRFCTCTAACFVSCFSSMLSPFLGKIERHSRTIRLGFGPVLENGKFSPNVVRNQKYNVVTFIPLVLFQQFKFFLNLYFLIMACSQFIPAIQIGSWITYWGPLGFVLTITLIREALDDFVRFIRDREMNSRKYERLTQFGYEEIESKSMARTAYFTGTVTTFRKIQVGDLIVLHKDQRIPADLVLLKTTEKQGACFIRTDQLDGETDWKLRIAVSVTQQLPSDADIFDLDCEIYAEKPQKDIHGFVGTFKVTTKNGHQQGDVQVNDGPLDVENTLWANTVLASGRAVGVVIYTGRETRSVMNTTLPESKVGLLDLEVNTLTKILFLFVLLLSFAMVAMKGFDSHWHRYLMRFVLLFSYIIPIRWHLLDFYEFIPCILVKDRQIPDTVIRSSTISEELGRIGFLLSDKTGTLTKNEMVFKKLHLGTVSFSSDSFDQVATHLTKIGMPNVVSKQSLSSKVKQAVEAVALCHNVTPLYEDEQDGAAQWDTNVEDRIRLSYQAASPDEVALVSWSESVGFTLIHRDLQSMRLRLPSGDIKSYQILQIFPFTSETKCMGIIVKDDETYEITFLLKGADTVMRTLVQYNDWLDEESSNMAREGLRTLVVAKKPLSHEQYREFEALTIVCHFPPSAVHSLETIPSSESQCDQQIRQDGRRSAEIAGRHVVVVSYGSRGQSTGTTDCYCTDQLYRNIEDQVTTSLELLKNAGIKIWMLTGDKQETAVCIAKSSGLFSRTENVHVFGHVLNRLEAHAELNALRRKTNVALVITGAALNTCLQHYESEVAELICGCTSVVCCRCSPEQKAHIVLLLRKYKEPIRVAAIGDGGNDVSMIQAAHAGIGIEAKEGRQASLAADFSLSQFSHVCRLLLVHGRYCYKRSCSLSQFVMHRGLIISTMQAVFSSVFYLASVSLYQGLLMVAYSTIYTMFPVFSLVMDRDVEPEVIIKYPDLYKELAKGRSLSLKTFCIWVLISLYQGTVIMYGALLLFDDDFIHVVSISFTALIFTELIMVALTIHIWHWAMFVAELFSVLIYIVSLFVLDNFFDRDYVTSRTFLWKTLLITVVSCAPLYIAKFLRRRFSPPSYAKVS